MSCSKCESIRKTYNLWLIVSDFFWALLTNAIVWGMLAIFSAGMGYTLGRYRNPMLNGHYEINIDREIHHCYRNER